MGKHKYSDARRRRRKEGIGIKPICYFCKERLEEFGGILLSPPNRIEFVKKMHVCKRCFSILLKVMEL